MKPSLTLTPIGYVISPKAQKAAAGRQPELSSEVPTSDLIEISPVYHQALSDLEGFSHLWILFWFDQSLGWKPKVQPPRGIDRKVGVFATRSPYRPNPLGLSLVPLIRITEGRLEIGDSDLLDGTPIFDIKPYVAISDSLPDARLGWMEFLKTPAATFQFSQQAQEKFAYLEQQKFGFLDIVKKQLEREPLNSNSKRVRKLSSSSAVFAYRLWRVYFEVEATRIQISDIDHVFHIDVEDKLKSRLSPFEIEMYQNFRSRFQARDN